MSGAVKSADSRKGTEKPKGGPGPEGQQGAASQVEKTLIDTVQSQATEISALTAEVTGLTGEVLDSLLGSSVAVLGNLLNVPSPPDPLGTFECA